MESPVHAVVSAAAVLGIFLKLVENEWSDGKSFVFEISSRNKGVLYSTEDLKDEEGDILYTSVPCREEVRVAEWESYAEMGKALVEFIQERFGPTLQGEEDSCTS